MKAFLAGKRGICPHCNARFRIPEESLIAKDAPKIRPADGAAPATAVPSTAKETETEADQPVSLPPPEEAAVQGAAEPDQREGNPPQSRATDPSPPAPAVDDPIAEAPMAVWYVRPPSGGQYGPAQGDVMRRWIDEGRVSADTLVWREGWAEWQLAGPLFPSLSSNTAGESSAPTPRVQITTDDQPLAARSLPKRRQRSSATRSAAIIVTLVLLVGFLLIALAVVVSGGLG